MVVHPCIIFTSQIKKLYKAELYDCMYCALIRELNTRFFGRGMRLTISCFNIQKSGNVLHILNKINFLFFRVKNKKLFLT